VPKKLKLLVITQNETNLLAPALDYFFRRLGLDHEVVGAVVSDASPLGKNKKFIQKFFTFLNIFGVSFVVWYGLIYSRNKLFGSDVKQICKIHGIPVINATGSINSKENLEILGELEADLFVSITSNQIFRKTLLQMPRLGTLNLHTALLPKYRGLMPSFWVLKNKEKQTGVSVFFVDEGIDSGPILIQKTINIEDLSLWELIRMTKFLGMEAILEGIELIQSGEYELIPNDEEDSTYFSFPTRQDMIEFKKGGNRFF